jgi:hypothetical protein
MSTTDKEQIRETIAAVSELSDLKQWEKLESLFVEKPYVDEEQLTKQLPGITTVRGLIATWKKELSAYFYATRRNVNKMVINLSRSRKNHAECVADQKTSYFITDRGQRYVWEVAGTYTYKLVKRAGQWKISQIHFNLKQQYVRPLAV